MTATQTWNTTELVEKDKAHLLHPVSNLKEMREHGPLILARGEGIYLWDTDGKRYIDAFAGLWNVNVGHGRKVLADAAAKKPGEPANLREAPVPKPPEADATAAHPPKGDRS